MLLPAQQVFEPTVEWPNPDCDGGPDRHFAEVAPWHRQEQKVHGPEKGLRREQGSLAESCYHAVETGLLRASCHSKGCLYV